MKLKYLLLLLVFLGSLSAISYRVTQAFFSDTATSTGNVFTAATEFPAPPVAGPQAGDVVINEVFAGGSSTTEWVEILNKTASPIDISGWTITDNGSSDAIPASTILPANGYGVIRGPSSTVVVPGSAITIDLSTAIGSGLSSSDDRLTLSSTTPTIIDQVSWGTDTTAFDPSAPSQTGGESLARFPDGTDTNSATDWGLDASPTVGIVNSL